MRSRTLLLICVFFIVTAGCGGDESTTGIEKPGGASGSGLSVTMLRPSPCKRISGDLVVNVSAESSLSIRKVYVTLNGLVKAVFDSAPYGVTIPASELPSDGAYTLKVIAEDSAGNVSSDETEINIDLASPYKKSVLVVDADADPYGLGNNPGAVFRINPVSGNVCTLVSSEKFVDPVSIEVREGDGIYVSDFNAYPGDEGGPGKGAVFKVWEDREYVEPFIVSDKFRAPVGIDLSPSGTVYIADFMADPGSLGLDPPPGAIFSAKVNVNPVVSDIPMVAPIGVTQKSGGGFWIVDSDAEPNSGKPRSDQKSGCLWSYDGAGLDVAASSSAFITPFHVVENPDGTLTMTDSGADTLPGRMYTIDPTQPEKSAATLLKSSTLFRKPSGFIRHPCDNGDPCYLIADRDAQCDGSDGAILEYNPLADTVRCLYRSGLFVNPMGVAISSE